jgi:hypothetical protein
MKVERRRLAELRPQPPTGHIQDAIALKQALFASSSVQGGGKRRMEVMIAPFPLCAESDAQPS